jgi:DNA-binding NarL/FixJ family response regulator
LIVDPDEEARAELLAVFDRAGFDVLVAESGLDAIEAARHQPPGVAILEIPLGELSGYEVCRALRAELGPDFPIVFLSGTRTEPFDRVAGLLLGADDYIIKPYATDELLARVRRLVERSRPIALGIAERLTARELEVLKLLADGLTQAQIAGQLFISPKTVGTHIEHILAKLGVRSRAQAVAVAYREDLVEAGD